MARLKEIVEVKKKYKVGGGRGGVRGGSCMCGRVGGLRLWRGGGGNTSWMLGATCRLLHGIPPPFQRKGWLAAMAQPVLAPHSPVTLALCNACVHCFVRLWMLHSSG
jgi:hypothetical protein